MQNPAGGCREDLRGIQRGINRALQVSDLGHQGETPSPSIPHSSPSRSPTGRREADESVEVEAIAAAAIRSDQVPPIVLRLEDVCHAQAF